MWFMTSWVDCSLRVLLTSSCFTESSGCPFSNKFACFAAENGNNCCGLFGNLGSTDHIN
jgi:hypothetical protein